MKRLFYILVLLMACTSLTAQNSISSQGNGKGLPFFKNYLNREYEAHNRNFDILTDKKGRTFVANFEGVLVFDHAEWQVFHTPNVNRVLCLFKDDKENVWFGGFNVLGYIQDKGYDLSIHFIVNDSIRRDVGEVDRIAQDRQGNICFHTSEGNTYMVKDGKDVKQEVEKGLFPTQPPITWNNYKVEPLPRETDCAATTSTNSGGIRNGVPSGVLLPMVCSASRVRTS